MTEDKAFPKHCRAAEDATGDAAGDAIRDAVKDTAGDGGQADVVLL